MDDVCEILGAIAVAILTGVAAAGVWAALAHLNRERVRRQEFGPLEGTYTVTRKLGKTTEPETTEIQVNGNVLEVVQVNVPETKSVVGQIVMNELLTSSGRGHYDQVKTDGEQLYGFWDIQVKKDKKTILVHTTFVDQPNHRAVVTGYVWSRRPLPHE